MRFLPSQTLTPAQKRELYGSEENWAKVGMDFFISSGYNIVNSNTMVWYPLGTQITSQYYKKMMYDVYSGAYDYDAYNTLVTPFKNKELALPTTPKNFNIVKSRVDVLRGEEMTRMFSVNFFATNREAVNMKQKKIEELAVQKEIIDTLQKWKDQHGIQLDEDKIKEVLNEYRMYANGKGKLEIEKLANDIFKYLKERTDWDMKTNEGFFNLLVTASCCYKVESFSDEVNFRVVNPLGIYHNTPQNSIFYDDCDWIVERRIMSVSDIVSELCDYLSEEEIERLGTVGNSDASDMSIGLGSTDSWGYYGSRMVYVFNVEWISKTKIKLVTRKDKDTGVPYSFLVTAKDEYKKEKGDIVESKWVNEVWEGVRIGGQNSYMYTDATDEYGYCIYARVRKKPNQFRSIDNMARVKLSYTGVFTTVKNTISQSLVGYGMVYQELYNTIWFRIERLIAQAKGKIIGIDVAQIPYSKGLTREDIIYYMGADGIYFFNSMELNAETGLPPSFNQFREFDLTLSNSITQYLQIAAQLKNEWEELSGLSRQRMGEIKSTETVGGVERSVSQSNMITEPLFFLHNQIKKRLALLLVEEAKETWKDGKETSYAIGEEDTALLRVLPNQITMVDYGISAGDSAKQRVLMQKMDNMVQMFLQSSNGEPSALLNGIELVLADSIAEIKTKLELAIQQRQQIMQQAQQADMQMKQSEIQTKVQLEQAKLQLQDKMHSEDIQLQRDEADLKKQIEIAKARLSYLGETLKARLEAEKLKGDNPDRIDEIESSLSELSQNSKRLTEYDDLIMQIQNGEFDLSQEEPQNTQKTPIQESQNQLQ